MGFRLSLLGLLSLSFLHGQDVLFFDDFEEDFLEWETMSYFGDVESSAPWERIKNRDLRYSGEHLLKIDGTMDTYSCSPQKSKILLSPPIWIGYNEVFELRFWQRHFSGQHVTHNKDIVILEEGSGIPQTVHIITATEVRQASTFVNPTPWVERIVPIEGISNKTIRIGFWYRSLDSGSGGGGACADTWYIEDVKVVGNASKGPGQSVITEPQGDLSLRVGDSVSFAGRIDEGEPGSQLIWEFCAEASDNCRVQGRPVGSWQFTSPGVFEVLCYSRSPQGEEDPTPARRTIKVFAGNIPPELTLTSPRRRGFSIPLGHTVNFTAQASDHDGSIDKIQWFLRPGNIPLGQGATLNHTFQNAGVFGVLCVALDNEGAFAYETRQVDVIAAGGNIPSVARIVSPAPGVLLRTGEAFDLFGEVIDHDGTGGKAQWDLGDGRISTALQVHGVSYEKPGRYTIKLQVRDGLRVDADQVQVQVYDPQRRPAPRIMKPATDILVQPGQRVYFEGMVDGHFDLEQNLHWNLSSGFSSRITSPGALVLSKEGEYLMELSGTSRFGLSSSQPFQRKVVVRKTKDKDFEPNNSMGQAALILPGTYAAMELAEADFFKVAIPEAGMSLALDFQAQGSFTLAVYDKDQRLIRSQRVVSKGSARFDDLPQGNVYLHCEPEPGKGTLSFGMGVSVLHPNLYFTDLVADGGAGSALGMVNPNNQSATVELIAYDSRGAILKKLPMELAPFAKFHENIQELFGEVAPQLSWVRADSTLALNGYSVVISHDALESYALSAVKSLAEALYVPHVAQQTQQWFTRLKVVNGSETASLPDLLLGDQQLALSNQAAFTKTDFDVLDLFQGTLPEGAEWGWVREGQARTQLAGSEVFGKVDGTRVTAGLGLSEIRRDNPNLFYIENDIFFTHIARDTARFWTGIALVNIQAEPQNAQVLAYGPGGVLVGEKQISLPAYGKVVELAETFLAEIGSPAEVDWVRVRCDVGVVGYELFGTHDNKTMAGLEASAALKKELIFPVLDASGASWHGLALVNPGETGQTVKLNLYSSGGILLKSQQLELAPWEKKVASVEGLFGELPVQAGYVRASAAQPLAGFQLFGDLIGERMAGLVAE